MKMGCRTLNQNPQFLHKRTNNSNSTQKAPPLSLHPNLKLLKLSSLSSSKSLNEPVSTINEPRKPETDESDINFKTLGSCSLGISRYPDFSYDATGGAGSGTTTRLPDGRYSVEFDVTTLYIPPLSTATTKFLGLPLPPFLKIDIFPETFRGEINRESGKVDLKFVAKFCFSVGSLYEARPLLIETVLTSEESKGEMREGRGERLGDLLGWQRLNPSMIFSWIHFLAFLLNV